MLVIVKTPYIRIEGAEVPKRLITFLESEFDTVEEVHEEAALTPGAVLRSQRVQRGWSQAELGRKLGGVRIQRISDIETGRRQISRSLAKKLAEVFGVSTDNFL